MPLPFPLPADAILPALDAHSKRLALKEMARVAALAAGLPEKEVFGALMEREQLGCTGMGHGVCIPQARFEALREPYALFARLMEPVEFGAADHKPVDLLFLLLTPLQDDKAHIGTLAAVSRLMRDRALCDLLRQAEDGGQIRALLEGRA